MGRRDRAQAKYIARHSVIQVMETIDTGGYAEQFWKKQVLYMCCPGHVVSPTPVGPWLVDLFQNSSGLVWVLLHRFADELEYSPVIRTPHFRNIVPISEGASRVAELGEVQLGNWAEYRE